MTAPAPGLLRRHRRAFLAGLGLSGVAAAGYGCYSVLERTRRAASRSADL